LNARDGERIGAAISAAIVKNATAAGVIITRRVRRRFAARKRAVTAIPDGVARATALAAGGRGIAGARGKVIAGIA